MKPNLLIKHLTMILGSVLSLASVGAAQNLCRSVLINTSSRAQGQQVDLAIKDLAKLKLFIDTSQSEGGTTSVANEARKQFEQKKKELQKLANLTDSELTTAIRQEVVRAQEELNLIQKNENAQRAMQETIVAIPSKRKTIALEGGYYNTVEVGHISEKNDLAVQTYSGKKLMLSVLNLKTGKSVDQPFPQNTRIRYVTKDSDFAVLETVDFNYSTINLLTGVREEWTDYNHWKNAISTDKKGTRSAKTISIDQKFLIFAKQFENDPLLHIGIFETATGKLTRKIELSGDFDFGEVAMINEDVLFLSGFLKNHSYMINLKTENWSQLNGHLPIDPIFRTKSGSHLFTSGGRTLATFDIATGKFERYFEAFAQESRGFDHQFAYQVLKNNSVRQISLADLKVVAETPPHDNQKNSVRVTALRPGSMLGQFIDGVTPLAIYDNRTLEPIFKFDDIYAQPNLIVDSVNVIHNGTQIVVQYKFLVDQLFVRPTIDIWSTE